MEEPKYKGLIAKVNLILLFTLVAFAGTSLWRTEYVVESVVMDRTKHEVVQFLRGIEQQAMSRGDVRDADNLQIALSDALHEQEGELGFSVEQLYAYNVQGKVYAWIGDKEKPRPLDGHYGDVIRSDRPYLGDEVEVSIDRITGRNRHLTDIIVPLHDAGKVAGGLEAEINLDATMKQIQQYDDAYEQEILLIVLAALSIASAMVWLALRRV